MTEERAKRVSSAGAGGMVLAAAGQARTITVWDAGAAKVRGREKEGGR